MWLFWSSLACCFIIISGQTKCCYPKQFEGRVKYLGSDYNNVTHIYTMNQYHAWMSTDITLKRSTIQMMNGTVTTSRIINDWRKGVSYNVTNGDQNCTRSDLFMPFDTCVSSEAVLISSTKFGTLLNTVHVDVWQHNASSATFQTTVSRQGCYPLASSFSGWFGQIAREGEVMLTNLKAGVSDPTVFDIPGACYNDPAIQPCCLPDVLTAAIVAYGGVNNKTSQTQVISHVLGHIHVDEPNNRIAVDFQDFDVNGVNGPTNYSIADYGNHRAYIINAAGCTSRDLPGPMFRCIPNDATLVDETFLGGPYNNMKINIWKFPFNGTDNRFGVTRNECYPVFDTLVSQQITNGAITQSAFYYNDLKLSVNASIFNIPNPCPLVAG